MFWFCSDAIVCGWCGSGFIFLLVSGMSVDVCCLFIVDIIFLHSNFA